MRAMPAMAKTVGLLLSNCFMTAASYGHLRFRQVSLVTAIALAVFVGFAWLWLGEGPQSRYLVSFGLIPAAVAVAFR